MTSESDALPSKRLVFIPLAVTSANSPSFSAITCWVCVWSGSVSLAIQFSPSPTPMTSGEPFLAQTITSCSLKRTQRPHVPLAFFKVRRTAVNGLAPDSISR